MTAKEYLEQVYDIDKEIAILTEQLESVRNLSELCAENVTSRITGMPKSKGKTNSPMADAVCEMLSQEQDITEEIRTLSEKREDIRRTVNMISDLDYRSLLSKRYLRHKSLGQIASETMHSRSWIQKKLASALNELETLL